MIIKNLINSVIIGFCFIISVCFATNTSTLVESETPTINTESYIKVKNAWARFGIKNQNSAIYLEIQNESDNIFTLVRASSDIANKVELHESFVDEKGISKMVMLDKLVIPANSIISLKPKSIHIMLLKLKKSLEIGNKFNLSLYFDNGVQKIVEVEVKKLNN